MTTTLVVCLWVIGGLITGRYVTGLIVKDFGFPLSGDEVMVAAMGFVVTAAFFPISGPAALVFYGVSKLKRSKQHGTWDSVCKAFRWMFTLDRAERKQVFK